jgi:hypothetical protein
VEVAVDGGDGLRALLAVELGEAVERLGLVGEHRLEQAHVAGDLAGGRAARLAAQLDRGQPLEEAEQLGGGGRRLGGVRETGADRPAGERLEDQDPEVRRRARQGGDR